MQQTVSSHNVEDLR